MNKTSKTTPNSGISIVFFGTGPVAAESLALLAEYFSVEAVVTKPRPPHHKASFPVLDVAARYEIPVMTVSNATEVSAAVINAKFASSVAVLIDFGIIVRQDVIDSFPLGILNSHFSLLPQWRGADPITFSILSGQKQTGVSLMKVVEKLDEGDIVAFGLYDMDGTETNYSLTHDLVNLSAGLLRDTLPRYMENPRAISQDNVADIVPEVDYPREVSYSRKLTKKDGIIDLAKPAAQLEREVRAYLGWPGSRTVIANKDVVITAAHVADNTLHNVDKKTIFIANKQLCLQAADGILVIDSLKPAGKPAMPASAFLAGYGRLL
jgi:methionyl-tRNA formyltransferase